MVVLTDAFGELFTPHFSRYIPDDDPMTLLQLGPWMSRDVSESDIAAILRPEHGPASRGLSADYQGLASQITQVTAVVRTLQTAMQVTALGLQYSAFLKFRRLTPSMSRYMDGHREYRAPERYAPTQDDFVFCLQFIIAAALRRAAAEADLAQPAWLATGVPPLVDEVGNHSDRRTMISRPLADPRVWRGDDWCEGFPWSYRWVCPVRRCRWLSQVGMLW
jgi:hypothetical protein